MVREPQMGEDWKLQVHSMTSFVSGFKTPTQEGCQVLTAFHYPFQQQVFSLRVSFVSGEV